MALGFGSSTSAHAAANVTTITTPGITTAASGSGFVIVTQGAGSTFVTPTDSKSNTYVQIGTTQNYNFGSNRHAAIWYCANGVGDPTGSHTATGGYASGFVDQSIYFKEITSTVGNGITLDQSSATVSSTLATTAITTTVAVEAILAVFCGASTNAAATHTVSGGSFAIDQEVINGASNQDCTGCVAAELVSSIQTALVATFTEVGNSGGTMAMFAASFKEAAGAGAAGSAAITEGHDIANGVSAGATGTAAVAENHDTISASAGNTVTGIANIVQAADVTSTGAVNTAIGTAVVTEYADLVTSVGSIVGTGTAIILEGSDSSSGSGIGSTIGSGTSLESADIVSASGILSTTGAATIAEMSDVIAASGIASSIGSAIVLEGHDTIVGVGISIRIGSAAIIESGDISISIGIGSTSGSSALTESHDTSTATGIGSTTGSSSIVESSDVSTATGVGIIQMAGAITEQRDGVVGLTLTTVAGVFGESPDSAVGLAAILNPPATAALLESSDLVSSSGVGTLSRFGSATVIAVSQTAYQAAQSAYVEGSTAYVQATYTNDMGLPFVPQAVWYRIDDLDTNTNILGWTSLVPSFVNEALITSQQNAIVSLTRDFEQHQVLFQIIDGYGDTNFAGTVFDLVRAASAATMTIGSGNIVEELDSCTGGS
jgi:hypothetical protein